MSPVTWFFKAIGSTLGILAAAAVACVSLATKKRETDLPVIDESANDAKMNSTAKMMKQIMGDAVKEIKANWKKEIKSNIPATNTSKTTSHSHAINIPPRQSDSKSVRNDDATSNRRRSIR